MKALVIIPQGSSYILVEAESPLTLPTKAIYKMVSMEYSHNLTDAVRTWHGEQGKQAVIPPPESP